MIEDSQGLARIGNAVGAPSWSGLFTGGSAPVTSPTPTPTATSTPTSTPTATATSTPTSSGTCPADPGDGTTAAATLGWGPVVAGDEFNYTGAPDPTKWNVYVGAGNAGQGQRVASAINVNCGVATISGDANGNTGGMGAKFADQKYGRWEARMKTSTRDPKYHPVSILWPSNDVTTNCDEIDYAEGNNDTTHMNFFLHYGCSGTDIQTTAQSSDWGTAWHNYAVEWSPSGITGYIDGVKWFTDTNPAHQPVVAGMHQTLQLDWFPDGSATTPTTMDTAWVRVYDVNGSTPSPTPTPTATATPTPTPTATATPTQTPPPSNVLVLLTPGATQGDYSCRTDYPATNSTCVLVLAPNTVDPASTVGQVHLDQGTDGKYTCLIDYPGYANTPCTLTTNG
jgi:hypothetical protein